MKPRTTGSLLVGLLILGLAGPPASAQPAAGDYVTREEYEKLLEEIQQLKTQQRPVQPGTAAPDADTEQAFDDLERELKEVRELAQATQPGLSRFLVTGYGFAGYTDAQGRLPLSMPDSARFCSGVMEIGSFSKVSWSLNSKTAKRELNSNTPTWPIC